MLSKQEILDEINKTKEHLFNMEKMLGESECKRWKPKENEDYYYVNCDLSVFPMTYINGSPTNRICDSYNCFKTREEAQQESDKIWIRRLLEDIARRLNRGRKLDWLDIKQPKYFIYFSHISNELASDFTRTGLIQGAVYCLDSKFLDIAIQEIGRENLRRYIGG